MTGIPGFLSLAPWARFPGANLVRLKPAVAPTSLLTFFAALYAAV